MLRENKGVTLVALVITIIVLLILAAVSISLVVGDNGVMTQAVNAVDETTVAEAYEWLEMAISSAQADFFVEWVSDQSIVFDDVDSKMVTLTVNEGKTTEEELTGAGQIIQYYVESDEDYNCYSDYDYGYPLSAVESGGSKYESSNGQFIWVNNKDSDTSDDDWHYSSFDYSGVTFTFCLVATENESGCTITEWQYYESDYEE